MWELISQPSFYDKVMGVWLALAAVTFFVLFKITAPYGKFARAGYGIEIRNDIGWLFQESPSFYVFFLVFLNTTRRDPIYLVLTAMFLFHYAHRSFIFPFRSNNRHKKTNLSVVMSAFGFTVTNSYLIGMGLFVIDPPLQSTPQDWARLALGGVVFAFGFYHNFLADTILINLRKPGETDYKIPYGGLFTYVTAANYLGEAIEWTGFAIASQTPAAWAFVIWTVANLLPRALDQHRWYLKTFDTYSKLERKAFIPWVL
mmetsp:Transcript_21476/g.39294  ORF Transcript_21476/g.39294 Transcript_21476/m.39294 type:complete len:258 (-) Transcript_21476:263-1036(-)